MTKKTRCLAMIVLVALLATSGLSAIAQTVLSTEKTKAYQLPSTSSASVTIPAGTTMEMTAEKNGWVRVERGEHTAYMKKDSLTKVIDCNEAIGYTTDAAPMYKEYGSSAKYGTLPAGTAVTVYAVAGDWCYVRCEGYKGYVNKNKLSTKKPATAQSGSEKQEIDSDVVITKGKHAYAAVEGAKVYKSYTTSSKLLGTLPVNTRLSVDAVRGDWAFVSLNGFYGFMKVSSLSSKKVTVSAEPTTSPSEDAADKGGSVSTNVPSSADLGKSSTVPAKGTAKAMDWWDSDIQSIFPRGATATITDVATGIAWKEMRKGGTNHADVQPLTAADTAAMKAAVGSWSWNRRAVWVVYNGTVFAASINGMPHAGQAISGNDFNGHHCIHFYKSKGHGSRKQCPKHQACVLAAYKAGQ